MQVMGVVSILVVLLYLVIPTGLLSILQYFLARVESPWPGRVLPILSAVSSVCMALFYLFSIASGAGAARALLLVLGSLLMMNIPTVVYCIIYRCTRKNYQAKKDMDKMNIQDLE